MGFVADQFTAYARVFLRSADPRQIAESRRAFVAGAAVAVRELQRAAALPESDSDHATDLLTDLIADGDAEARRTFGH